METKHHKVRLPIMRYIFLSLLMPLLLTDSAWAIKAHAKYYLEGTDYRLEGEYEKAIDAFKRAIGHSGKERKRVRFYGMRYGAYMPHREKGICHYYLKQYLEAIEELEISIRQLPSEEAKSYLLLAKREFEKSIQAGEVEIIDTPEELERIREAAAINPHGVGVVIGNRDYADNDIPTVSYAIRDAAMVKKYLIRTFGFRIGNIIFVTNATKGRMEGIFGSTLNHEGTLHQLIKPGRSDLFVYYSGHGAPHLETKRGYILPVDGNPHAVSITGYSIDLLYKNLSKLHTRSTIVVTDACFSGALLFKKASPVGIIIKNPLVKLKNTVIMNSSSGTQLSSWYPQKGHGLFTYYFLRGLTGEADLSGDNRISYKEISSYLENTVRHMVGELYYGRIQTPTFQIQDSKGIMVSYR